MSSLKKYILAMLILVIAADSVVLAQDTTRSVTVTSPDSVVSAVKSNEYKLNYKDLIVPTAFLSYGILSLEIPGLKQLNISTKNEINEDRPHGTSLDNYSQYMPAVLAYGLNAAGIKGKHKFRDRTIIYAASQLISAAFVIPLKHIVKEERPDRSNDLSFPSGHSATAFSSAQFMFMEYKDTNFWLSISGYTFAVFTGVYRAINNKHWAGDIVAGAGFGVLSTELAYWLYPKLDRLLPGKNQHYSTMIMPSFQYKSIGIGLVQNF